MIEGASETIPIESAKNGTINFSLNFATAQMKKKANAKTRSLGCINVANEKAIADTKSSTLNRLERLELKKRKRVADDMRDNATTGNS
jgi:hypothetical protein